MSGVNRLISNVLALAVGFFGGLYLHYYAALLLYEHTDLRLQPWNYVVPIADFALGACLVALAIVLIIRRGFNIPQPLLLGFGASMMGYYLIAFSLCVLGGC